MSLTLEFSGERFVPGIPGEIVHEHWHRYAFAQSFARGRRVLDVACGEGYGSALLAANALSVTGIDISAEAVQHATARYGDAHSNLRFLQASVASLPLADRSVDLIVSFETIEHLPQSLQAPMIDEFVRVLAPDGILILSSPNRPEYSPPEAPPNPFHIHELDRKELEALLAPYFSSQVWLSQRQWFGSTLWREAVRPDEQMKTQAWQQENGGITAASLPTAKYFIVVAASDPQITFSTIPDLSLFSDADEEELKRLYHHASEVLRLDKLALERQKILENMAERIQNMAEHIQLLETKIRERDAMIELLNGKITLLECSLKEKEAFLRYRESLIGWLRLPFSHLRRYFFSAGRGTPTNE
jgi:ubiquinone/menaquinone biosynthesis C-methylase UbiE